jgi:hypothetical protein
MVLFMKQLNAGISLAHMPITENEIRLYICLETHAVTSFIAAETALSYLFLTNSIERGGFFSSSLNVDSLRLVKGLG